MKVGDDVVVVKTPKYALWKEIEGRQGVIEAIDILGNVHVRIRGHEQAFVLTPSEVKVIKTE